MGNNSNKHHVFVLMGVSGCGKSAVATGLTTKMSCAFLDGDFLHPRANIQKMAAGHALDDQDRRPWLMALNDAIFAMQRTHEISLLVCSALKKQYRDMLRQQNQNLYFLYLRGDFALIENRLQARKGHFFKPQMLLSQFATLEEPTEEETDCFVIDIHPPLNEVIDDSMKKIFQIMHEANL